MNLNLIARLLTLAIIVSTFCSCNRNHLDQTLLIGDWSSVEINGPYVFIFQADGICDYKQGFITNLGGQTVLHTLKYLGTRTKYYVDSDSLKILNLAYSKYSHIWGKQWTGWFISKLTKDSLVFSLEDGSTSIFRKNHLDTSPVNLFDQVIVHTAGCFGDCPAGFTMVSRSGQIDYKSEFFNTVKVAYRSKISHQLFDSIESAFKISNFLHLKNHYAAGRTDQSTTELTFIKDNKIIKEISDYGYASPTDFKYAYQRFSTLYQFLKLTKLNHDELDSLGIFLTLKNIRDQVYGPSNCEQFYLISMLRRHQIKSANFIFSERYFIVSPHFGKTLTYSFEKGIIKNAVTDGQIFKITTQSGKTHYYDLGFNYIKKNNLAAKFKFDE